MKIKVLALAVLAALAAQNAVAQTTTVSTQSLLADGYEIKSILDVSSDEQKIIYPNDAVSPYIMITLQKGPSVAVCTMAMSTWIALPDASLANATLCRKH